MSGIPWVTSGSQAWNGERPNLIDSEIKISVVVRLLVCGWNVHRPICL